MRRETLIRISVATLSYIERAVLPRPWNVSWNDA